MDRSAACSFSSVILRALGISAAVFIDLQAELQFVAGGLCPGWSLCGALASSGYCEV